MVLQKEIERILLNPKNQEWLAILKGFRSGAVYGAKIRFPHALVMTFLFRDGPIEDKVRFILRATFQHARNLAFFATIWKTTLLVLRRLNGGKERYYDTFLAGFVGGWFIFGEDNPINQQECDVENTSSLTTDVLPTHQICFYLFGRVVTAYVAILQKKLQLRTPPKAWAIFAALIWGSVMWQFRNHRDLLQPSLAASMIYIYSDSEKWTGLQNFLLYNK
ncbi:putative peroxisomal membrane protein [Gonapodya prolifera JEL478]|uniref:Putative peroxisomal membrane protein n=1 Tax=Gonapodya prolifera (strain JEL478) TaxID=1344416 RepID=A0A139ASK2_GONPJ|nr:putative peroxisomal membrane protein [Gonapodya prolifera JEL478]|eukprot:KXS19720.1 putative peroxisomal membrane protein [Gonapodya prolifera JEL478]